jgi:GntR family transcriptional regulator
MISMTESISTYQRLQNELSDIIHNAKKGTKLPSEPELAKQLDVSRATLREAMRTFESQGLLRRRQGLGTFVLGPTQVIESGLEVLESIETQAERIGVEVTMGDCDISSIQASSEQAEKLLVEPGSPLVQIRRVILTDNAPVAYLIDILPEGILTEEMLANKFTGSVLDLLIKDEGVALSISKTDISATHAPKDIAKALDIQRGDTLLLLNAILYDQDGSPVDLSRSYFLPGNFRLHIIRKIGGVST